MKRIGVILTLIIIFLAVKNDLTHGTIQLKKTNVTAHDVVEEKEYFEHKVSSGETVLSIVEAKIDGPLPVPVSFLIDDFRRLNNNFNPEKIKIGKQYKFPNYDYKELP